LIVRYKFIQAKFRGAWCKRKFYSVGDGLRIDGPLGIAGLGKVIAGRNLHLDKNVVLSTFTPQAEIRIGSNVLIGGRTFIGAQGLVTIGDNTMIAGQVMIFDSDFHGIDDQPTQERPIRIGSHVWIGIRAMILEGVTIGDNSIVGAGSVVSKSVAPNSIVAGNPARFIRETKMGYR
jgi:acetyltransferase-like isoleucine patch superfamily enzyme